MNPWWPPLRTMLSGSAVLLLVHLARAKDVFSDISRPTVLFALHLLGLDASDHGSTIAVGRLEVPWTRDCAGLNLLLVLVALTIWVNRSEPAGYRYWSRILLAVPAALGANVLRVLSLIAYREAIYPGVESPQLHYFLGLVWLLPFVALVVPKGRAPLAHVLVEALQAAAVVALLAPMSGVPGEYALTTATIICLAHCKVQTDARQIRSFLTIGWMLLAGILALVGMESFWIPWLLLCPVTVSRRWIFSPAGAVLTIASCPLFGLIPGGATIVWLAVGFFCWRWVSASASDAPATTSDPGKLPHHWPLGPQAAGVFFILPFIASTVFARDQRPSIPPAGTSFSTIAADTFEVRVPGQSANVGLLWFNPSGNGRHHTVKVCMKYRGVDLEPTRECAEVFTDGRQWMREFYLVDGQLVSTYADYLMRTLRPRSSPGVHLIFVTSCDQMTPGEFAQSCRLLASYFDPGKTCRL